MQDGSKRLLLAAACIVVAVLLYWATKPSPQPAVPSDAPASREAQPVSPAIQSSPSPAAPRQEIAANASRSAATVNTPQTQPTLPAPPPAADPDGPPQAVEPPPSLPADPAQDLEEVQGIVRNFRDAIGGNPVGTNAEITSALLGDNSKQLKLSVPPGSRVNEQGELVDRWGTPYFFHQLSAKEMEIRSAGPDRRMWTGDDRQAR